MTLSVLLVDDSGVARTQLRQGISQILPSCEIYEAESALEAGRFLFRSIPDVLFLDLNMPGVSGMEFLERLDIILNGRRSPIIVSISGDISDQTLEGLKRRGAYDILPKPFSLVSLAGVILRTIQMTQSRQVLLIDDSATVRTVVRRVIQKSRFNLEVFEAGHAEAALKEMKANRFDLAFVDFNMPGVDGLELAGDILYTYPRTKVVMMSGQADEPLRRAANHMGIDFFLSKPFYASDVDAVLHTLYELKDAQFIKAAAAMDFSDIELI